MKIEGTTNTQPAASKETTVPTISGGHPPKKTDTQEQQKDPATNIVSTQEVSEQSGARQSAARQSAASIQTAQATRIKINKGALRQHGQANLSGTIKDLMSRSITRARNIKDTNAEFGNRGVLAWSEVHSIGTDDSPDVQIGRETLRGLFNKFQELGIGTVALELPQELNSIIQSGQTLNQDQITKALDDDGTVDEVKKELYEYLREVSNGELSTNDEIDKLLKKGERFSEKIQGKIDEKNDSTENNRNTLTEWEQYRQLGTKYGLKVVAVDTNLKTHLRHQLEGAASRGLGELLHETISEAYELKHSDKADKEKLEQLKQRFINLYLASLKVSKKLILDVRKRDVDIAQNLAKELKDPNGKNILFTGGKSHISFSGKSATNLLKGSGIPVTTIECCFPQMYDCFSSDPLSNPNSSARGLSFVEKVNDVLDKKQNQFLEKKEQEFKNDEAVKDFQSSGDMIGANRSDSFYNLVDGISLPQTQIFPTRFSDGKANEVGNIKDTPTQLLAEAFDAVVCCPNRAAS